MTDPAEFPPGFALYREHRARYFSARRAEAEERRARPFRTVATSGRRRHRTTEGRARRRDATG